MDATEMPNEKPTIKGMFVKSHLRVVHDQLGERGLAELERRYGKRIEIRNSDNILISDEVRIIELTLDLLTNNRFTDQERSFEAGKLHFRNFAITPFGNIILSVFKTNFKLMMMHAQDIAGHVFQGVRFSAEDIGDNAVKIIMENNDYPLEHFRGLFQEWMMCSDLDGNVEALITAPDRYQYVMRWVNLAK